MMTRFIKNTFELVALGLLFVVTALGRLKGALGAQALALVMFTGILALAVA